MIKRLFGAAAAALLVVGVAYAVESGLSQGAEVPTIHIDAFNDNRGSFCVTCEAGRKPAVVAFVTVCNDETKALLSALDKAYTDNREKKLYAGVVILGNGECAKSLKSYVETNKLTVPTAHVAATTDEIKKWKLNDEAASTTFFITGHKVQANAANLAAGKVAEHVGQILG